jgi:hypothetical protein
MFLQGEMRNKYNILVGESEGKRPNGRPTRRWEKYIKINLNKKKM